MIVDGNSKKTGSLDGDYDVVLSATPGVSGTVLTVTVTDIDEWEGNSGVEVYYINVIYEN